MSVLEVSSPSALANASSSLNIPELIASELSLAPRHVLSALDLYLEGGTIPFIARYRKERTGEMTETNLRALFDRYEYLKELEERKETILKSIEEQGKLTDDLRARIIICLSKTELEDLYLPYKPKKRTRATVAKEKGLEPLAAFIAALNKKDAEKLSIADEAAKFLSEEKGVKTAAEALQGASDILAETVSENADYRQHLRDFILKNGTVVSSMKPDIAEGSTKFEMYRSYKIAIKDIQPHNILALRRGEAEDVLRFDIEFDEPSAVQYLQSKEIHTTREEVVSFYKTMLADAFDRLMKTTLIADARLDKKSFADDESVKTFEANLKNLLLSSPAGMKPTLGVDPGFRTGCKVAALDATGKFLEYKAVFPHQSDTQRLEAAATIIRFIETYSIELIAIGNGTAGRETDEFVTEVLNHLDAKIPKPIKVMVSEAGASVYSASEVAVEEFPELDVTVRGAISIARRLQDPLAELVKIDPKSIGVGQYQHDVDQKLLKKKLEETVESCVNFVGVDLNTASSELLKYVSGITSGAAKNIVKYRNEKGAFKSREELLEVPKFGAKTFEQAAGFLRIRGAANPLDNTAVHPERYDVVKRIAHDLNLSLETVTASPEKVKSIDLKKYVTADVGEPTLRDILAELEKPGRDPRAEFKYAHFKEGIKELKDLKTGMELEGVVTNVANFGAFVDVGVHQDGLVHVSQLADRFVKDPNEVVKVGQIVKVRVVEVNENLKRISLSMRKEQSASASPKGEKSHSEKSHSGKSHGDGNKQEKHRGEKSQGKPDAHKSGKHQSGSHSKPKPENHFSLDDLKARFNSK
jgi:protein Tex